jgi:hypothetical protein
MRPSFVLIAFISPLLFAACGVGTSQTAGTGPTPGSDSGTKPDNDAGDDADASASCLSGPSNPGPACTGCDGNPVSPECVDGTWQCPIFGCPAEFDAGCGGSFYPSCPVTIGCGPVWTAECVGNQWTCEEQPSECGPDASVDVFVPPVEPVFACGNAGCDPTTSYCQVVTGGPVLTDGGSGGFSCIPLPSSCTAGAATCACVQAVQGIGCGCVEAVGDVTVTCELP